MNRKSISQDRETFREHKSSFNDGQREKPSIKKWKAPASSYTIQSQIDSPATSVMFPTDQSVCLKIWKPCLNGVYNTENVARCTRYSLEGLAFNSKFAKDVYVGIAPIVGRSTQRNKPVITCGQCIAKPELSQIETGVEYALIMRRLEQSWRLDHKLHMDDLGNREGMEFLAREIAQMHRRLRSSPPTMGTLERIEAKLELNGNLFIQALEQHFSNSETSVVDILKRTYTTYSEYFKQRHTMGHIKRCHGDLKTANLWVKPDKSSTHGRKVFGHLLALDCVDFNPEFCHIDTLSDVAMLAIDIEMRLKYLHNDPRGSGLVKHFLTSYLKAYREESQEVQAILEYYMTEKAMVCTYMSILYDGLPSLGEKYLEVANIHACNLSKLLKVAEKWPSFLKNLSGIKYLPGIPLVDTHISRFVGKRFALFFKRATHIVETYSS